MSSQTALCPDQDEIYEVLIGTTDEIGPIKGKQAGVPVRIISDQADLRFVYSKSQGANAAAGVKLTQGVEVFDIPNGSYIAFSGTNGDTAQVVVLKSI